METESTAGAFPASPAGSAPPADSQYDSYYPQDGLQDRLQPSYSAQDRARVLELYAGQHLLLQ